MIPLAVLDLQVFAVAAGVGRQIAFVEQALFPHEVDELRTGQTEVTCGLGECAIHGIPLTRRAQQPSG